MEDEVRRETRRILAEAAWSMVNANIPSERDLIADYLVHRTLHDFAEGILRAVARRDKTSPDSDG